VTFWEKLSTSRKRTAITWPSTSAWPTTAFHRELTAVSTSKSTVSFRRRLVIFVCVSLLNNGLAARLIWLNGTEGIEEKLAAIERFYPVDSLRASLIEYILLMMLYYNLTYPSGA